MFSAQDQKFVMWCNKFIAEHGLEEFLRLLRNKLKIPIELPMDAIWRAWQIEEGPQHKGLSKLEKVQLFKSGDIGRHLISENHNKIMDVYKWAIIQNNIGSPSSDQHLQIDYLCLGTADSRDPAGTLPTVSDTKLTREYYRAVPTERYRSNGTLVVILYLEATDANPTNTTVASGTRTTTTFPVQAGQGSNYHAGDVIRVNTGTYEVVTVLSVSTDQITLHPSTPLSIAPPVNSAVERGYGEVMMVCGDASATLETGTPVNHADLRLFKNNVTSCLVECHLAYVS